MPALTVVEADLLDFIETYMAAQVIAPTIEEIRVALGYKAKSQVFRMLVALQDKGAISRRHQRTRSIEVLMPTHRHATQYETQLQLVRALSAPAPRFNRITLSNIRLPRMESSGALGVERPQSPSPEGHQIQEALA